MRTAAEKRPLCVICIALMLFILLAKAVGLPLFGEPPDDPALTACVRQEKTVQITGTVKARAEKSRSVQYILTNSYLRSENNTIPLHTISMVTVSEEAIPAGSVLLVSGTLSLPEQASNPGQFDLRSYYAGQRIYYSLYAESCRVLQEGRGFREGLLRMRQSLSGCLEELAGPETAEIMKAMLLGDRSDLGADRKRSYQVGGVLHILAISGVKILSLVSPLPPKKPVKWAFLKLHIAQKYIIFLCVKSHIFVSCPS